MDGWAEALALVKANRHADALPRLEAVVASAPNHGEARWRLGRTLAALGRPQDALPHLELAVQLSPQEAYFHNTLGTVLARLGRRAAVVSAFQAATSLRPDWSEAWSNLGNALRVAGDRAGAAAALRRATALAPELAIAWRNLADSAESDAEALAAWERHAALTGDVGSWRSVARLAKAAGDRAKSLTAIEVVITQRPDDADAHMTRGLLLHGMGRLKLASVAFQEVARLSPDRADAWYSAGVAESEQQHLTPAITLYRRAVEVDPLHVEAWNNLGNALKNQGLLRAAATAYRRALAIKPDKPNTWSNLLLCLQYDADVTVAELLAAHQEFGALFDRPDPGGLPQAGSIDRSRDRVLRVGFVSPDLGKHPVGWFLAAMFPHLRRLPVEIACYSSREAPDEITAQLRGASRLWVDARQLSDESLLTRIRADRIDVLVDLSGHTRRNRLPMFGRRAAPVQVTWAGYVGTTGLKTMDWVLSDHRQSPPWADSGAVERIWRMPDDYVPYAPPVYAPPVGPLPGLHRRALVLGCFNNLQKLQPSVIALWSRILREIPHATLFLKCKSLGDAETRERYLGQFASHGVPLARLQLEGRSPHDELLGRYNEVDLALDPFPYSGGLTTLESLWMGVPVVTLGGERLASRHTITHLTSVGLTEMITDGPEAYVAKVRALDADRPHLARLRAALRDRMARAPVCDGAGFARDFHDAVRQMWWDWLARTA
jgi:protein O-GlcNAc transferase